MFVGVVFEGYAEYLTKSRMYLNLWNNLVDMANLFKHCKLHKDNYKS